MEDKTIGSKIIAIIYLLIGIISPLVFVKVFFIDKEGFTWYWLLLIPFFLSYFGYSFWNKKEQDSALSLNNRKTATITLVLTILSTIFSIVWAFYKW